MLPYGFFLCHLAVRFYQNSLDDDYLLLVYMRTCVCVCVLILKNLKVNLCKFRNKIESVHWLYGRVLLVNINIAFRLLRIVSVGVY